MNNLPLLALALGPLFASSGAPGPLAGVSQELVRPFSEPEQIEAALASWNLTALTSPDDPTILLQIELLAARARASLAAGGDPQMRAAVSRVESALQEYRRERGLMASGSTPSEGAQVHSSRPEDLIVGESVRSFVVTSNLAGIQSLGSLAVPHLVSIVGELTQGRSGKDPAQALRYLVEVDVDAALDTIAALSEIPSLLVRNTLANELDAAAARFGAEHFVADGQGGFRLAREKWNQITENMLAEPSVELQRLVAWIWRNADYGILPEGARRALLASGYSSAWRGATPMHENLRPFFEAALLHSDSRVRKHAVEVLAATTNPEPVLALANDPTSSVRAQVAEALGNAKRFEWAPPTDRRVSRELRMEPSLPWRQAARRLLEDADPEIRNRVLSAVLFSPSPLERELWGEVWLELAKQVSDPKLCAMLLTQVLNRVPTARGAALDLAFAAPSFRSTQGAEAFLDVIDRAQRLPPDAHTAHRILAGLEQSGAKPHWRQALSTSDSRLPEWVAPLDDRARIRLLRSVYGVDPVSAVPISGMLPTGADPLAWRECRDDAGENPVLRLLAARGAIGEQGGADQVAPTAAAVLAAAESFVTTLWEEAGESGSQVERGGRLAQQVLALNRALVQAGAADEDLPLLLARDPAYPRIALERTRLTGRARGARAGELAQAVLARHPDILRSASIEMSTVVLDASPWLAPEERHRVWSDALSGRPSFQSQVLASIRISRDRGAIGLLREAMGREDLQIPLFADTLVALGGDDAVRMLLDLAALAPNREAREQVMQSLDQLLALGQAELRWKRGMDGEAQRQRAIAALVALLDAGTSTLEQRVEAVRGLGLLDAREELPRVIGMLASEHAPLAEAARGTLARWNASEAR